MTSINTNVAAMTALQTLQQTNSMLDETQGRISTGFKVGSAKDNAAYWSIATTMRSDNKSLSAVVDSLGIGSSVVDTAYTALSSSIGTLDNMKQRMTAATQSGVDRSSIQSEIEQLQSQLRSNAEAATFSGQNWLAVNSDISGNTRSIVSSFNRSADNGISIGQITVDVSKVALTDAGAGSGILDKNFAVEKASVSVAAAAGATVANGDTFSFAIAVNGGTAATITVDKTVVDAALNTNDGVVSAANTAKVLNYALRQAGVENTTASFDGTNTVFTSFSADKTVNNDATVVISSTAGAVAASFGIADKAAAAGDTTQINRSILTLDVSDKELTALGAATDADKKNLIGAFVSAISGASDRITTAASDLGSVAKRIDIQKDFTSSLMDAIDRGVGTLVDADMTEESTRLKALQTQQQLGVQALSIANSASESILSLFR